MAKRIGYGRDIAHTVAAIAGYRGVGCPITNGNRLLPAIVVVKNAGLFAAWEHDPGDIGIGVAVIVSGSARIIVKMSCVQAGAVVPIWRSHTFQPPVIVIGVGRLVIEWVCHRNQSAVTTIVIVAAVVVAS